MASTPLFRSHHQAPPNITSPLLRDLLTEWVFLNRDGFTARDARRWATKAPALEGAISPAHVVDMIDEATGAAQDELLLALIELAQGGDQPAGRTLLQAFLPGLTKHRASRQRAEQSAEDRMAELVGDFWQVLHAYPLATLREKVGSRLLNRTLHYALRSLGRAKKIETDSVEPTDIDLLHSQTTHLHHSLAGSLPQDEPAPRLDMLLDWALAAGYVSAGDAALIADVYSVETGPLNYLEAAQRRGISQAAARQRCSRAVRQITEAIHHHALSPIDVSQLSIEQLAYRPTGTL